MSDDSDYDIRRSPGLERVYVKARPSPEPLPFIPKAPPEPVNLSPQSEKDRRKSRRRITRPVLGDGVLLSYMNPNYPDVAKRATEIALNSASHSEVSDSEMEDRVQEPPDRGPKRSPRRSRKSTPQPSSTAKVQHAKLQAIATQVIDAVDAAVTELKPTTTSDDRMQTPPADDDDKPESSRSAAMSPDMRGLAISALEPDGTEAHRPDSASSAMETDGKPTNIFDPDDTLATSPNLRNHTIKESEGSPAQKLPALHVAGSPNLDGPGSPTQTRNLPSFSQLKELADVAQNEADARQHRASFSSTVGPPGRSPPAIGMTPQGMPISLQTPRPSLSHASPTSINGETSPQDAYMKGLPLNSGAYPPTPSYNYRRESQASETGPPHLSTTNAGPTPESVDGSIVSANPSSADGHRMSIDMNSRMLPLPVPQLAVGVQHIPPHGAGSFKCDFPGCNAAPFQTQYLLNSHANVHSQNRPHYCPVPGCPRGEGGKGFKRKNEMIRHGLVHDSPGYVCPFCPDREHKYPRPDNLQRHVRVHHIDKDRDDPLLREVLSQRPEGGNRGRRRRMGS